MNANVCDSRTFVNGRLALVAMPQKAHTLSMVRTSPPTSEDGDDEQYDVVLTVRVSERQARAIRRQAKHLALPVGSYLRMKILADVAWEEEKPS
jgi:hypothetical protein